MRRLQVQLAVLLAAAAGSAGGRDRWTDGSASRRRLQDANGEEACEGHGYDQEQCDGVGCCNWDDGGCVSAVGDGPCESGGGGGGQSIEQIQAACPDELAACQALSTCQDEFDAVMSGGDVDPDTATAEEHVCVFDMDADACLICGRTAEEVTQLRATGW